LTVAVPVLPDPLVVEPLELDPVEPLVPEPLELLPLEPLELLPLEPLDPVELDPPEPVDTVVLPPLEPDVPDPLPEDEDEPDPFAARRDESEPDPDELLVLPLEPRLAASWETPLDGLFVEAVEAFVESPLELAAALSPMGEEPDDPPELLQPAVESANRATAPMVRRRIVPPVSWFKARTGPVHFQGPILQGDASPWRQGEVHGG
jgi:hypothetical protein